MLKHILLYAFVLTCIVMMNACKSKPEATTGEVVYNTKVSAFTSGIISNEASIQLQFSEKVTGITPGQKADEGLLSITPSIDGQLQWLDMHTLEFVPDERMPSGTSFKVEVDLPELFTDEKEAFSFTFSTIDQNFRVQSLGLEPDAADDLKLNTYRGRIAMADHIDNTYVEQLLKASQDGNALEIEWEHQSSEKQHAFAIKGIQRSEQSSTLLLEYNGKVIGVDKADREEVEVPSLTDFKVIDARVVMQPEQYVLVVFSDPLDERQNINGLISISGASRLRYVIERNRVKVYPSYRLTGSHKVTISEGIKNILGYTHKAEVNYDMVFETPKPEVQLIGKGTILPNSNGLTFPFKAVSVKSVQVRIIKIFENNVASFLQVNTMNGQYQLRRAGRLIFKQNIRLDNDRSLDLTQWNTFSLNLADLITPEQGAIYRVELKIRKKDSLYPCGDIEETNEAVEEEGITESDMAYWDQPAEYYSSYWDGYEGYYDWRERENPCADMYYRNKVVSRNILASDIGIIAKQGTDKEVVVAITDLRTTQPLTGVEVEIFNYQMQVVGSTRTDAQGLARIPVSQKPFLLIAKNDKQRGYLRLDDGHSLSLSRFDVSGQVVQKGMKGFIYGERGVWRPGDTLFVSFMLENKGEALPKEHPIVFEWVNPHGQTINRQVQQLNDNNIYVFKTQTSTDAPTGMWRARVKVGGSTFEKGMRVETIKPNRLKINLDFNTELLVPGEAAQSTMTVSWLHGAIARNLKADVKVTLNQSKTQFKKYSDFHFDDPSRRFESEESTIFEGRLDEQGQAIVDAAIDVQEAAPGFLKASFVTRVFEESGDFSIDRFSVPYAPYPVFVGVKAPKGDKRGMLLTDTTHTVQVVTVSPKGEPMTVRNLSYYIYKVSWRWWWESSADNLANYVGTRHQNLIASGKVNTTNGEGQFDFRVNYPEWGRYLIRVVDDKNGHATGQTVYVDWPGWAGNSRGNDPSAASMLAFNADKEKYQVGEEATISFPASGQGRALVSIENGNKVLKSWWVEPTKGENQFSFEVTADMTPNAFVHLTLLQPHAQTVNNLPIRMYGVIPLMAEDPQTHIYPLIKMPSELRPEKEVSIKVSERDGRAMTYTLAIVEDGLLDLTRFKTPVPWNHFYAREALGVKTWDLYDEVIGAYGGKIEQIFSIGGDGDLAGKKGGKKANRFKPMVKYFGPFALDKGDSQTHTFTMPRYVGSVRTMVVASSGNAYGETDMTTPVRNPLMVLATLPRVLGPNETVDLPVTVFAMKEGIKNVKVKVEGNELLTIDGATEQDLTFNQLGEQVATFKLKVHPKMGVGKVKVYASSGGEKAMDEIEIEVRNPNPPLTAVQSITIDAGASNAIAYQLPGMAGTNKATLEVSALPPFDFGRRLKYLLRYPHGCVEQTTSAAFPQLFLADVIENGEVTAAKATENVKAAINRLAGFIRPDGGLGYWPGSYESSDWGTTYAGHFMIEAERKGYNLPVGFKNKWIKYQKNKARQWRRNSTYRGRDLAQAYRLYTLALAGEPELSAMNRMRNQSGLSTQSIWRLAAAYALAGHGQVAQELTSATSMSVINQRDNGYTYGSEERDLAMILETLVLMDKKNEAGELVQKLSKSLSAQRWMSTQTTAYCLLAVSKFVGESGISKEFKFEWEADGEASKVHSQLALYQYPLDTNKPGGTVKISNTSDGLLFARVIMEGIPAEDDKTVKASNLQLTVQYKDLNGNTVDVSKLAQGTDFMAEVTVKNPGNFGDVENLALTQIFPSGWEIRNTRMEDIVSAHELSVPDYRDYRDDRVYSYFDLERGKHKKFVVLLNATYTGRYYLSATSCEAMYNNSVSARQPGQWVDVIKAGE
ncbi:alpha-2-macroglobulin [Carboxylicivirga sp. A043]|uniref:alpha-2-macroglobulin family protein n=1 Tax=Carboxylicivirga litoralis TaxID=2816963 RepID=UPI0021CB7FB6|nr:MG2 domain-containing protein [Carboxylicivirga sp. A043]MCU4156691.1 alpha-2-macroglobulin [Carboxylicivirga sp. A043]